MVYHAHCGFGAHKALVARRLCEVEPKHSLVSVDACAPPRVSTGRTTVAHNSAARVHLPTNPIAPSESDERKA
jgi:hypothetical protein